MAKKILYPLTENGSLLHYYNERWSTAEMVENRTFTARLSFKTYGAGSHGSKWFMLEASDGRTFPLFFTEAMKVIQESYISMGAIDGIWSFQKRGSNFSLKFLRHAVTCNKVGCRNLLKCEEPDQDGCDNCKHRCRGCSECGH